jgi:hypothetical protein
MAPHYNLISVHQTTVFRTLFPNLQNPSLREEKSPETSPKNNETKIKLTFMRQVDIIVFNYLSGAMSSYGTCVDLYDFFARTIDNETHGRYEFQEWGFDLYHAADKVRRDYIKFYNNLSKRKKAALAAKGEMDERDKELLEKWRTDDLVFVYYLVNDREDTLTRKKVIFPKEATGEDVLDFYRYFKFPDEL